MTDIPSLKARLLQRPGIAHGFFGRRGGVSQGVYASLNGAPASKDSREALIENRRRIAESLGGFPLVTLMQYQSAPSDPCLLLQSQLAREFAWASAKFQMVRCTYSEGQSGASAASQGGPSQVRQTLRVFFRVER